MSFDQELDYFIKYRELYLAKNPQPEQNERFTWRDAGFLYILKIVCVTSAIFLAGFRTAEQFFHVAASTGNYWLGWIEAGLAVLAIEGLIVALAADKARRKQHISPIMSTVGILLALGISLLAGLGQSLQIVEFISDELSQSFQLALAVGLAFASLVAFIGGEILGQELASIEITNRQADKDYREALDVWENGVRTSWDRSKERKQLRRGGLQLTETYSNLQSPAPQNTTDWRILSKEERSIISSLAVADIVSTYGVTERTAYNWKQNSLRNTNDETH